MKVGSIIMDLASEFGGNCQLTKHNEVVNYKSVRIVGPLNIAASISQDSSRLYSKNVLNFLINSCRLYACLSECSPIFVLSKLYRYAPQPSFNPMSLANDLT